MGTLYPSREYLLVGCTFSWICSISIKATVVLLLFISPKTSTTTTSIDEIVVLIVW